MKHLRLKDNKVIAVWTDNDSEDTITVIKEQYSDFDTEKTAKDTTEVYTGMTLQGTKYVQLPTEPTIEEQITEIDKETSKAIFDVYSDNAQRTLTMRAIMGDREEFEQMTAFVNVKLAEGKAQKDALTTE